MGLLLAQLLHVSPSQHEQQRVHKASKTAAHLRAHRFCINQSKNLSCPTQNSVCVSIVLENGVRKEKPASVFPPSGRKSSVDDVTVEAGSARHRGK